MGTTRWGLRGGDYEVGTTRWGLRGGDYEVGTTRWGLRGGDYLVKGVQCYELYIYNSAT